MSADCEFYASPKQMQFLILLVIVLFLKYIIKFKTFVLYSYGSVGMQLTI